MIYTNMISYISEETGRRVKNAWIFPFNFFWEGRAKVGFQNKSVCPHIKWITLRIVQFQFYPWKSFLEVSWRLWQGRPPPFTSVSWQRIFRPPSPVPSGHLHFYCFREWGSTFRVYEVFKFIDWWGVHFLDLWMSPGFVTCGTPPFRSLGCPLGSPLYLGRRHLCFSADMLHSSR